MLYVVYFFIWYYIDKFMLTCVFEVCFFLRLLFYGMNRLRSVCLFCMVMWVVGSWFCFLGFFCYINSVVVSVFVCLVIYVRVFGCGGRISVVFGCFWDYRFLNVEGVFLVKDCWFSSMIWKVMFLVWWSFWNVMVVDFFLFLFYFVI